MGLRILFAGVPMFANALRAAGHTLCAAVLPWLDDEPDTWDLVAHACREGIPVLPAEALTEEASEAQRHTLNSLPRPQLLVVMSFPRKVASWARALPELGAWNVHPSLLPRYRGYNPYYWVVRAGETESGLTVHHLAGGFDDGDIIAQRRLPLPATATSGMVWQLLTDHSMPLLLPLLDSLERGEALPKLPQDHRLATPARKPRDEDLEVDITAPVQEILAAVRAATPDPGAHLFLPEGALLIRGAIQGPKAPSRTLPGELFVHGGETYLSAIDGSWRPLSVEPLPGLLPWS